MRHPKRVLALIVCLVGIALVTRALRYPALSISGVRPGMSKSTVKSILGPHYGTGLFSEIENYNYFGLPPHWEKGDRPKVYPIKNSDIEPSVDRYILVNYDESGRVRFVCSDHLSVGSYVLGTHTSMDEIRSTLGEEVWGANENGSYRGFEPGIVVRSGWSDSPVPGLPRSYFLSGYSWSPSPF